MSRLHLGLVFGTALLEVVGSSFCALWPLRHQLRTIRTWTGFVDFYSIAGSNLDVWLQSVSHSLLIPVIAALASVTGQQRRASRATGKAIIAVIAALCQVRIFL